MTADDPDLTTAAGLELAADTRVHLIGIGGSGMSALAQILLERDMPVSGIDLRGGPSCMVLEAMGATIHVGHDAGHVEQADVVVVSNAVPRGNVERQRAHELGIPVVLRADLLELLLNSVLNLWLHQKLISIMMVCRW